MIRISAAPEEVGLSAWRLARINAWMNRYVDSGKLPCALTLVARHGEAVFLEYCGHRDLRSATPIASDTIFRLYSMTKPVTSVAAMMLYEEGRFQLDDPVSAFIPALADMRVHLADDGGRRLTEPARSPITIHHLLTHTAGFTYGFRGEGGVEALYKAEHTDFDTRAGSLGEVVDRLARLPLVHHPGTRWHYGVSTDVLGYLIEVVSGMTLDRFFAERLFEPLGMTDTGFVMPEDRLERFASLYEPDGARGMRLLEDADGSRYRSDVQTFSGGGGLLGTVSDYYRFTEMLRRRGEIDGVRLLGRKTVDYMTRNHLQSDLAAMGQASFNETTLEGIGFGLGFSVMLDPARARVVGSPGEYAWGGLASTAFWVDPAEDMTVIFLTQLSPSDTYPLRRELRVLAYQSLVD